MHMRRGELHIAIVGVVLALAVIGVTLGSRSFASSSGPDACLIAIHDPNGPLTDGTKLCQVASGHTCTFSLQLCLNEAEAGCTPGSFATNKRFAASGHCGPVRKLQVTSSGTSSVCGSFTGVTVRTRSSGKKKGQCTIRAAARTAKTHARTDVDRVTLTCEPPGGSCP